MVLFVLSQIAIRRKVPPFRRGAHALFAPLPRVNPPIVNAAAVISCHNPEACVWSFLLLCFSVGLALLAP